MPSNVKKTLSNGRKRVTASARARISTRKVKGEAPSQYGLYLQEAGQPWKPTKSVVRINPEQNSSPPQPTNSDILNVLQRLEASNRELSDRVNRMEQNSTTSTPLQIRSKEGISDPTPVRHGQTIPVGSNAHLDIVNSHHTSQGDALVLGNAISRSSAVQLPPTMGRGMRHTSTEAYQPDTVFPDLNVLRHIPTVADTVNDIMASYENQARAQTFQGKNTSHKSGRYNATDIITAPPEFRWPNEGYHGSSGRKRMVYDDLSMAQWAVGQLSNVYSMKNPDTSRQALLQVILAIRDATSPPWPAVHNAWAASMHEVENGTLTWGNSTQWALNRLSASQIAVMNSVVASHGSLNSGQVTRKVCCYYNKGTCLHDSRHGAYRHSCNYCSKQGRNLQHPETKCNFKSRAQEKPVNTS